MQAFLAQMKDLVKCNPVTVVFGMVGSVISSLFGGWDYGLKTLIILMLIDYVTGLIIAGVFKKSPKTESGGLESKAGWKGLCRKCMTMVFVLIANRIDNLIGHTTFCRDTTVICYIANELISIVENAGIMGIPIPPVITNSIDILKRIGQRKQEKEDNEERD